MQRRVVALLVGAAAVLIMVVVLFVRVRAAARAPAVTPSDLAAASRAGHEGDSRPGAASSHGRAPLASEQRAAPTLPESGAPSDQPELGSRALEGARAAERARRAEGGEQEGEGQRQAGEAAPGATPDLPADAPPEMIEKRRAVSDAYDTGDYEGALRSAEEFLRFQADNAYVQRVAAVSACAVGDESSARVHYQQMSESNQRIVQVRCRRFGITF
ncbi:MAG TPA: hypothetical protein VK698_27345 [Kofleriaceae bacterium]|nr:hypothetical protein [Kofleriaceae bacterium]